jgi:hypothetical protein
MTTKYGISDVRDQLLKDLKGGYPTKWGDFINARVLGEDIFGSPKPHPNAVLNLFVAQNVKFAIPFASYRASVGGLPALTSDRPSEVLPSHTLTTTVHGMHVLRSMASHTARKIAYGGDLRVCPDPTCTLGVPDDPIKPRLAAFEVVYNAMTAQREAGLLVLPPLERFLCAGCTRRVETAHITWGSVCWEKLALVFSVSDAWENL